MTRVVENEKLIPVLLDILKERDEVPLEVKGGSMTPFLIDDRDKVILSKIPEDRKLKVGDIVLFQRPNGQFVLHRLKKQEGNLVYFLGDAQDMVEGPLPESCMLAMAGSVVRKGEVLKPGDFWWDFFSRVWIRLGGRERRMLTRLFGMVSK